MIHIARGDDRSAAHQHDTVAEARECESDAAEAAAEVQAENAWLRAAEYNFQHAEETRYELWLESQLR